MEAVEYLPFVRKMPSWAVMVIAVALDIRKGALTMSALQSQAPSPQDAEEVLRSFHEWMAERARATHQADRRELSDRNPEAYFPPSIASPKPPTEHEQQTGIQESTGNRTSVGSRVLRTMVRGFILAASVGLVWQASHDDHTKDMTKVFADSSMKLFSPVIGAGPNRSSDLAAEPVSKLSDQNVTQPQTADAPSQDITPSQVAAPSVAQPPVVNTSTELQQQKLEALVSDLAAVRRTVQQLAGTQEQMSRDLAMLQAGGRDTSQKREAPAQTAVVHAPARKKVPKPVHLEIPNPPAAVTLQTPPDDTPSTGEKPPRPPLPLLTPPADTPSPAN
jgi:hypothetical protein